MFSHAPWLVFTVFALTLIWLGLVVYFFHYLKTKQPGEYLTLGSPSFQSRGSSVRTLSYIYRRGHRHLIDGHFSLLCDLMVVVFTLVVCFAGFAFLSNGAFPSWHSQG
jgi:hypothetical protein